MNESHNGLRLCEKQIPASATPEALIGVKHGQDRRPPIKDWTVALDDNSTYKVA